MMARSISIRFLRRCCICYIGFSAVAAAGVLRVLDVVVLGVALRHSIVAAAGNVCGHQCWLRH
jgi:hypothetical protein